MKENKNKVNNAVNDAEDYAVNDAVNDAANDAANDAVKDTAKDTANNAESYDFMADANATFKGLIDRTKEHGLFEQYDDKRVLVCIAMDFDRGKASFTAHGRGNLVAAGIVGHIKHHGIAGEVQKILDMYESGEFNIKRKEAEYENAEEVQDAKPAEEPVGEE